MSTYRKLARLTWTDNKGDELIQLDSDNRYKIIPVTADREKLTALRDAINDALSDNSKGTS